MADISRFLVVDDNREFAQDLCELLEMHGLQGIVAVDAEEALVLLERTVFQGMFTDLRLPGKNGVDLIEEVCRRALPVPVVVMTAYPDEELVRRARSAGAVEVLSKPLVMERWLELAAELSTRSLAGAIDASPLSSGIDSERPL